MEPEICFKFHISYKKSSTNWNMHGTEGISQNIFDFEPKSQFYEYKVEIDKIIDELLKFGLTKNQAKVFIYL